MTAFICTVFVMLVTESLAASNQLIVTVTCVWFKEGVRAVTGVAVTCPWILDNPDVRRSCRHWLQSPRDIVDIPEVGQLAVDVTLMPLYSLAFVRLN